ncbi:MAG: nitroreductase family protein [Malacoplasma sp.]
MKQILSNRSSIRKYKNIDLDKSILNEIKDIINSSPSAMNHQKFSVIFIQDQKTKDFISEKNGNQNHIKEAPLFLLFLVDCNSILYALNDTNFSYDSSFLEDDFVVGTIDATIASTMVQDFCLSQKLGVCYIGGVRFFGKELCKLLNIEGMATPILGMTIGYPNETPKVKPKMDKVFYELYSKLDLENRFIKYNVDMNSFYQDVYKNLNKDESLFIKIHNYYLNFKNNSYIDKAHYKDTFLIRKIK